MVPPSALHRKVASFFIHSDSTRKHWGIRPWSRGCQVRDTALQVHFHEREGEAKCKVLFPRVAHLGSRGNTAGMAAVQAPEDTDISVIYSAETAPLKVFLHGRRAAQALHRAAHISKAHPWRLAVGIGAPVHRQKAQKHVVLLHKGGYELRIWSILLVMVH
jgi:hypothetical protein